MSHALLHTAGSALAKPLYAQVRAMLLERIRSNEWAAGRSLPNEFALASHYNVSIGTIRRAVEGLEKAGVVVRKQGRGTFVARPEQNALGLRFGLLRSHSGGSIALSYRLHDMQRRRAGRDERIRLELEGDPQVVELRHLVRAKGAICGFETGIAGLAALPALEECRDLDTHPYATFATLGIILTRVEDTLAAVAASKEQAELLEVGPGAPLLRLERLAYALDDRPVEIRTAYYRTADLAFAFACRSGQVSRFG